MTADKDRASLAAKFDLHADDEGKLLADYRALAEKLGETTVGNLISHILTDEELHHLLLRTMAKWLREPTAQAHTLSPTADRAALLHLTQTLQHHEEQTIEACSSLQAQLDPSEDLLATLLDAMILDTEKHRRLLGLVEKMLKS